MGWNLGYVKTIKFRGWWRDIRSSKAIEVECESHYTWIIVSFSIVFCTTYIILTPLLFLLLSDPYDEDKKNENNGKLIDVDLGQSAFGNAQR